MGSVSIVGCGYTGLKLAQRWLALGATVRGFASRTTSLERISAAGAQAVCLNLDAAPGVPVARIDVDGHVVYYSVPPPAQGSGDSRLEAFFGAVAGRPRRLVYLGTTGVYGDRAGALVDEHAEPAPTSARALRRLAAETSIRQWAEARGVPWCILRIAGIYGPGRLPLERLRRAEPAILPEESTPGNRIHVDDLVTACMAAGLSARAERRIVNVADGSDHSATAYLQIVARLSGLPAPPLVSRAEARRLLPASAWSFLADSRRIDNRRLTEELGVALAYHDLEAGIRASL
jgi:nucleoside-diphosphate-sugar epimerase